MVSCICLFEDEAVNNFYPLTYTRPVFELWCGMSSLREKIVRLFPGAEVHLLCREALAEVLRRQVPNAFVNAPERLQGKSCLFVNGRLLAPQRAEELMVGAGWALTCGDEVVAAHLNAEGVRKVFAGGVPESRDLVALMGDLCAMVPTQQVLLRYPWDILSRNGDVISSDFAARGRGGQRLGKVYDGVHLVGHSDRLYVGEGAIVLPGCVLDTTAGPIYIDNDALVRPPSYVQGPCYIGEDCLIEGAKVREGCSFGRTCKIGGEVSASVFQGFSNKQHEGYLGHVYLGEWVNLGALVTNSNLKNNYKPVKVQLSAAGAEIDTHTQFFGGIIGDHTKVGIGGLLNTGTVLGVGCNIFGGGMAPRYVASFCWGNADGFVEHRLDK
ncbi:MAG: putative sugar nucleotidyl transferase, partial [Abditibacteriales bacterium]|nr:putative sugar nucleotidyl transferase [Abditibacteriales bacterium]MDW8365377.1 putative sugar nucleotidyl transferase [Abditibacteriales bacterium]